MSGNRTPQSEQPTQVYYPQPAMRNAAAPPPTPAPLAPQAEAPTEIWVRAPQSEQSRPNWLLRFVVGMALLVFGLLSVTLLGGALLLYESQWILPGVTVLEVNVGQQTIQEAANTLANSWQNRRITLAADGASWAVSPPEMGMMLDARATAELAHRQGRSWASLRQGWVDGGFAVSPVWQIDMAVARARLTALAPEMTIAPVDAGMVWANGRFQATPASSGKTLDLDATLKNLEQNAALAVLNGRFALVSKPLPPTITDMSAMVEQANALLKNPIVVRGYDPISNDTWTWRLTPEVWGQWLAVDTAAALAGQLSWSLDTAAAGAFVQGQVTMLGGGRYVNEAQAGEAIAAVIGQPETAVTLRIYHQPRQHTVRAGETFASIGRDYGIPYPWVQQANPGVEYLFVGQTLTIPSPDDLIPLPVVENKRIVVSITLQKVWVYENGGLKWEWPASTGIAESPTAPGIFQVQSHEENAYAGNWDLWMPHFMGIYRPVPTSEFMNGFHGFPTRGGSQLLWTNSLGRPVTYGCILISSTNAQALYDWAEAGVIVEIQP